MLIMGEAVPMGGRGIWKISAPSSQCYCKLETALKTKSLNVMSYPGWAPRIGRDIRSKQRKSE